MRMGAIFARGSCRALKWTAMFGVVFALGAGSAAAQLTPDVTTPVTVTVAKEEVPSSVSGSWRENPRNGVQVRRACADT